MSLKIKKFRLAVILLPLLFNFFSDLYINSTENQQKEVQIYCRF